MLASSTIQVSSKFHFRPPVGYTHPEGLSLLHSATRSWSVLVAMVHLSMSLPAWGCALLLANAHVPLALGSIFARGDVRLELALLNLTVGGRLHQATPWELPCFSEYNGEPVAPDAVACAAIQANYTSPFERVKHFGAYMMVRVRLSALRSDGL